MKLRIPFCFLLMTLLSPQLSIAQEKLKANKTAVVLSAIKGSVSKADTVVFNGTSPLKIKDLSITGAGASYFKMIPGPEKSKKIAITFEPPASFIGLAQASLQVRGTKISIGLRGLSTKGLEGENEAPLSLVVEALGYTTDVGWKTLPNHTRPEVQGDEMMAPLFQKANEGLVEIIPVARYSPDFPLNFGYYVNTEKGPSQTQVGILAKAGKFPQHQTLFPEIAKGKNSFDPGQQRFGIYATSPDHTLYSEDCWNTLFHPLKASHAVRIYPVKDQAGKIEANSFLIGMEEAANGDFNDYVFIIKNVRLLPAQDGFSSLMNGRDFSGWHKWFKDRARDEDPEKIFTLEDGVIHDTGKELGYIITEKSFGNFHLKLDFKWGEKRWAPRDNAKRDSGICYNIPDGTEDMIWPRSVECQIQEGDVGDFWLIEFSTIQVDGKQNAPSNHTQIVKKKDAEKPTGEWNTVEVISFNGKCVHIVNGVVVNYGDNASVIGGRLLLQSEYAEVFYRNIKIRNL